MILATNNPNPQVRLFGPYVSDTPRFSRFTTPNVDAFESPQDAAPSLMNPVVDPSYGGAGEDWRTPWMTSGNMLHADGFDDATYRSDPALHTQSTDKGTVPEHMLRKPAAAPALITGNARGSMKPPAALSIPNQRIPMGEALMRIGGAGVAASGQGGLAAIGAATNAYGQVQDANRQADMEAFAIEEARRKSIADRMAASASKSGSAGTGDAAQNAKTLVALQNANAVLKGFDDYDNVVGPAYWFAKKWDQLNGNERENIRLKINSMKVDRVLANIAQTKGAISEKEMDIFMSDQPAWTAGEDIWRKWVTDYRDALLVMHTNLANGTTVAPSGGGDLTAQEQQFLNGG